MFLGGKGAGASTPVLHRHVTWSVTLVPHTWKDTARVEMFDFSLKVVDIFHSGALQAI